MQPDSNKRDQFTEGNIRTRSLESIWFDKNCFSFNRDFSYNQLTGYCRKCQYRFSCRGGAKCMAIASTGTTLENPYCYFQVSQLNKKQSDLTHRKFIAATAATTLIFLGGYPGKVVSQEKALYSQSGQSVENNVNNASVERLGQGAITTQSLPPDDCIGVVYGINPPPQLGSLSGHVLVTENEVSDNIVGAMITISNEYNEYIGTSDSNGIFSIPDILVGEYNVKVEKVGFENYILEETWICTSKNTELPGIELEKSFPWVLFYPAFIKKK